MSLAQLQTGLNRFTESDPARDILAYVNEFISSSQEKYTQNTDNRALAFGKWKGNTMKDMSKTQAGKSYIQWLLKQTWFTEEKFPDLFEDMRTHGHLSKKSP
jgi:hypothetical protein